MLIHGRPSSNLRLKTTAISKSYTFYSWFRIRYLVLWNIREFPQLALFDLNPLRNSITLLSCHNGTYLRFSLMLSGISSSGVHSSWRNKSCDLEWQQTESSSRWLPVSAGKINYMLHLPLEKCRRQCGCWQKQESMQGVESLDGKTRSSVFAMLSFRRWWAIQMETSARLSEIQHCLAGESSGVPIPSLSSIISLRTGASALPTHLFLRQVPYIESAQPGY